MAIAKVKERDAVFALVENLVNVNYSDLPVEATKTARMDILDTLGVAIAASTTAPACKKMVDLARSIGGKEESTIISHDEKVPSHMASFANAALAHALNYDDFHDSLLTHFGCIIFPAAIASAERVGKVSGKAFITAYALGLDLAARLVRALITDGERRDWNHYGWILTQMVGYFSAAAVSGRLQGLSEKQLVDALGLASSQVAGSKQLMVGPGADKGIYPSYPALSGVLAVQMAQMGIAGPKESLEGQNGLYNVYFQGAYDPAPLTRDLGKSFAGVGFHLYPSCTLSHSSIELALKMVDEYQLHPEGIEAVTVSAGPKSQYLCEPLDIRRNPRIMAEAQYSLPFTLATAISKGRPRIKHFTSHGIKDPEILNLSNKVGYRFDKVCDMQYGTGICPAKIEIRLTNGRVIKSEQNARRYGHPERPISMDDLMEKFRECATYSRKPLSADVVDRVINMVDNMEAMDDVSQLIRLVS